MSSRNLHDSPFDQGTIAKLEIFEDYAEAWIPAFVMQRRAKICIFDFFAGTGYDKNGIPGSPIRILEKIKLFLPHIFKNNVEVHFYVNEYEPDKRTQKKFLMLKESCEEYTKENKEVARAVTFHYNNEDCETLFPKLLSEIQKNPSLVYLDQNGVKFLSNKYLLQLEKMKETDFLYFVSSSYIVRFGDTPEFKAHMDFDLSEAKRNPYKFIHRSVIEQVRQKLPNHTALRLYPFSIRKAANIYGIIFGASHPLAVDKFLTLSWAKNALNGEADFDIDDDQKKGQIDLFGQKKPTKMEKFKENVRNRILSTEIRNNFELLEYTHNEGHIGSHAADVLREMKKNKEIDYDGNSPLVTYQNVYKDKKKIDYTVSKPK
jgi:three-Cys-motif partner protein